MRNPLIIGNWKLNGSCKMVSELIRSFRKNLISISRCTVVIAPPEVYLDRVKRETDGSPITLGAQNVDIHLSGAFTGETSATMLKDIGAKYVIIGHSERRYYHNETNEFIAKKFSILKKEGLIPVLCVGESKEERALGKSKEVCAKQIDTILEKQGDSAFENAVIAYEPIWAIGSGKSAAPVEAQEIHKFIRNYVAQDDVELMERVIIQYGGSVNISNAAELFSQPDIDGALVGGASLNASSFLKIIEAAEKIKKTS